LRKKRFRFEQSRKVLEAGKRFGFKIKAHVDEFTNLGAARMAIELGATSIDHLDVISDEEIALLAASETVGVVTPTVNFNFGSKEFADARKLIDAGCAIAVSTDYNPGSAPCPSLPNAMAIACRYQKLLPSEAFNAATINAAFAVAKGRKSARLKPEKMPIC
jgi:imidazolonepropionase